MSTTLFKIRVDAPIPLSLFYSFDYCNPSLKWKRQKKLSFESVRSFVKTTSTGKRSLFPPSTFHSFVLLHLSFFAFWFVVLITETECICVTVDYSPDFGVTLHWLRRWNNFGGLIEIQWGLKIRWTSTPFSFSVFLLGILVWLFRHY